MTAGQLLLPAIKCRGWALFAIATLWMPFSTGCSNSPSHPPTFADFRRVGPRALEDEKKMTALLAVLQAAQFSAQDIKTIRAKGSAQELIGVALQVRVGDKGITALLHEAVGSGSNDPVVLTGVATVLLREMFNNVPVPHGTQELASVLSTLEQLEPNNSLPLCLRAYVQIKDGDTNAALLSVVAAMQKPALRVYDSELRRAVMEAALTARYSRFTASMLAMGTLGSSLQMSVVGRGILTNPQLSRTAAEACLELGRRQEAQGKLFIEQLIAYSLQKKALEFLKPSGFESRLLRLQEARDKIMKAQAFIDSLQAQAISEREWLAYFALLFEKSESEAVEELARKLNHKW